MVDMMECCFSIFGNLVSNCVFILSENRNVIDVFIKVLRSLFQRDFRECCIFGIFWSFLKEIVCEMIGLSKFEERGVIIVFLYFIGQKEVFNKVIYLWDDFEVYSLNFKFLSLMEEIEKVRNVFYKGV